MNTWSVYAHSVAGARHRGEGKANQDRIKFWTQRNRPVIALGDGAGSQDNAEQGAEIAVTTAGSEIVAYSCGIDDSLLNRPLGPEVKCLLRPVFENAFELVDKRIHKHAQTQHQMPQSFSVSLTAAVLERSWIGCISEGDVALVSGRPGHWRLVNKIFKTESPNRPRSRNATNLLPYRTANSVSDSFFESRQEGDLALLFCDGALDAFLQDTTPAAHTGSYKPNESALNQFYDEFVSTVRAARVRDRLRSATGPFAATERLFRAASAALTKWRSGKAPESPEQVIARWIESLVNGGEPDDITIVAAID